MYDNELLKSIISTETDEEIVKTYGANHSMTMDLKKTLISILFPITAVVFAICFYIIVFCGDVKKGSFAYDSVSYWIIISVLILAFALLVLYGLFGSLVYYALKNSALKASCKSIAYVLTSRRVIIVNTVKNEVLYSVYLADVSDISRYTDDQLKILTYTGKDVVIKPDDTQDFIDTYPGLLRSERNRTKRNA